MLHLSASEKLKRVRALVAVREDSHTRSVRWPAPLRASALKEQISLHNTGDRVFVKMSYHPCVSGCGRSLAPQDSHDRCLTCLGIQHAEEAFVDGSCSSCGDMTISELRNRLRCVKHGGVPLPLPRSGVCPGTRGGTPSGGVRGDLRITVRASPSGVPHPQALRSRRGYRWGTRASPLWSGLWPCNCVQQTLPLCGVNRVSPHGPVSIRQASLAVLIEPVGRRLLPYTPWRYCRSIRPKH